MRLNDRLQDLRWYLDHRRPGVTEPKYGFTLKELYEFDLQGFVVLERFVSEDKIALMNESIDKSQTNRLFIKFPFLELHDIFLDLLSDRRVLDICRQLCGDHFRFDEAMGVQEVPPHIGIEPNLYNLHAGPMEEQGSFQYKWHEGRPWCTHVQFVYVLSPVRSGDGGLVFVAGSHKQNMNLSGWDIKHHLLHGNLDAPWIRNPALNVGDLVVFSEATVHGTASWKPRDRTRRNLYYKYCPGYVVWRDYEQTKKYLKLARNDLERRLLRGPYVATYDETEEGLRHNSYREPTV